MTGSGNGLLIRIFCFSGLNTWLLSLELSAVVASDGSTIIVAVALHSYSNKITGILIFSGAIQSVDERPGCN